MILIIHYLDFPLGKVKNKTKHLRTGCFHEISYIHLKLGLYIICNNYGKYMCIKAKVNTW
jgi:hypothetical protein